MNNQNKNIIWIRHIEKLYKNGYAVIEGQHQHDPEIVINKMTFNNVDNLISELILKYGTPNKIIISPFLRTRQTAEIFTDILKSKYNFKTKIEYSTDIAEYLGFCKKGPERQVADLHPETLYHFNFKVYLGESFKHFKTRIENHITHIENENKNIWVITHGVVLSSIYTYFNKRPPFNRPEPLDYVVLCDNSIIKNF